MPNPPKNRPKRGRPKLPPGVPRGAGPEVLYAIARYPYITSEQATRITGYAGQKYVNKALKHLTDNHYLFHDPLPSKTRTLLGVWSLLGRGRTWLAQRGVESLPRVKHEPERDDPFLLHILAVNDVLIAFERFAIDTEGVELNSLIHDLYLRRQQIRVEADVITKHRPDGTPVVQRQLFGIAADGDVVLSAFGYDYHFWIEVDRGTEDRARWQKHVAGMVAYAESLGEERLDFVIVAPLHPKRKYGLRDLLDWTGEQLTVTNRGAWCESFRFTDRVGSEMSASDYITGPHWVRPGDDQLTPLIEGGVV